MTINLLKTLFFMADNKDLKLFYSISEVAAMIGESESLLRFWEKEFSQYIKPNKAGRNIRQYRHEDIENIKMIHHLVKECGMTLQGARQRLKNNKDKTQNNFEIVQRLRNIRAELISMREALDSFKYEQVDNLKENLEQAQD